MQKKLDKRIQLKHKRWMTACGVALCLIFLMSSPGNALWVGQRTQINPFIEILGTYETNEFRVSSDASEGEDSDFITIISPGIHFEMPTEKDPSYKATANYRANIKFYGNNGDSEIDPDEELDAMEHRLDAGLQFKFAAGLELGTGYILNITSDPPDFRGDTRNGYIDHNISANVGYAFANSYKIEGEYIGVLKSYDDSDYEVDDLTEHTLLATASYRIFPAISILGGGGVSMVGREEPVYSDSTEYIGYVGARYEATERTTGLLKIGAVSKNFDSDFVDDTTDVYASGELNMVFSETTTLMLRLTRDFNNSSGVYYVSTGIDTQVQHSLAGLPDLTLSGALSYSKDDYPEDFEDRSDNNFDVSLGADYEFAKYIVVGGGYIYSATDSDVDGNDFNNHTALIKLRFIM